MAETDYILYLGASLIDLLEMLEETDKQEAVLFDQ